MSGPDRPRLTIVLPALRGGGAERVVLTLARALHNDGLVCVEVISLTDGPGREGPGSDGVRVTALGRVRTRWAAPPLVRRLRRSRPTAVLSTLKHASVLLGLLWFLLPRGTIHVARVANTYSEEMQGLSPWKRRAYRTLIILSHRRIDHFICVSAGVRDDLISHFGVAPHRCSVVPNPVDSGRLRILAQAPAPTLKPQVFDAAIRFLSVGRLAPQKDHALLLRAFAQVVRSLDAGLVIVGEGAEEPNLRSLATTLGISDRVDFVGYLDNPYPAFRVCDVVVLTSRFEGSPNVLLEGLSLGKPCISSDCRSGPAELLASGRGRLFEVGDVDELVVAMLEAANEHFDPGPGIRYVEENHGLRRTVDMYLDALTRRSDRSAMTLVANLSYRETSGQIQKARAVEELLRQGNQELRVLDVGLHRRQVLRVVASAWRGHVVVIVLNRVGLWVALALARLGRSVAPRRGPIIVPVVGSWLGTHVDHSVARRFLARGVDRFLTETPTLTSSLRRHGLPADLMPNFRTLPVDWAVVRDRITDPVRMVFAGRVRRDKGVVLAAELTAALSAAGRRCTLDIWGTVEDQAVLDEAVAVASARYRGTYDHPAQAYEIFRDHDFLVLPSSYEGECMPGVVVEACFAGLPAIVSDWADLPEVVIDAVTGLVCPLNEFVSSARSRILDLGDEDYARMSAAALERARTHFTGAAVRRSLLDG